MFNIYEEILIKSKFAMSNLKCILARIMIKIFILKFELLTCKDIPFNLTSIWNSFGLFLNFDQVLKLVFTVRIGWHGWLWKSDGEPTSGSHMNKTSCGNQSFLFLFFILENWIGSFKELASDFQ